MRFPQILIALCINVAFFVASAFSSPLPTGVFPEGYEHWELRVLACQIKTGVSSKLRTYTLRGMEGIIGSVSILTINGDPFEAKYFEPIADSASLSGFRVMGFTLVVNNENRWVKFGGGDRLMTNNELIYLRMLRFDYLKRYNVTEREDAAARAACNRDHPGQLR
ncbi:MAG: hypothetical protein AAB869_01615 [Patescibacteria group bacterium]